MTDPSDTKKPQHCRPTADSNPAKRCKIECPGPIWDDLARPEIIGAIARNLPMNNSEVRNFLSCVRPESLPMVRKIYLTGNDHYLHYILSHEDLNYLQKTFYPHRYSKEEFDFKTYQIRTWMEYNEKAWKERCRGKMSKKNLHTYEIDKKQAKLIDPDRFIGGVVCFPYGEDEEGSNNAELALNEMFAMFADETKNSGLPILVSINDKQAKLDEDTYELLEMLEEPSEGDWPKEITLLRYIDTIFSNPIQVIEFGLVEVLKYMVEEGMVSPNQYYYDDLHFGNGPTQSPLYFIAAKVIHDDSCLKYLLTLDDIDTAAVVRRTQYGQEVTYGFLHIAIKVFVKSKVTEYFQSRPCVPLHRLESIINDRRFDINMRNSERSTPLNFMIGRLFHDVLRIIDHDCVELVRTIIKAGAEPETRDNRGWTPKNRAASCYRYTSTPRSLLKDNGNEVASHWLAILQLLD